VFLGLFVFFLVRYLANADPQSSKYAFVFQAYYLGKGFRLPGGPYLLGLKSFPLPDNYTGVWRIWRSDCQLAIETTFVNGELQTRKMWDCEGREIKEMSIP
ncbi:MAG: hypothetical protein J6333_07810, partial [Planctomycetes bacterium]|nr:hypothetical protein [Planctomycetota bacterium]